MERNTTKAQMIFDEDGLPDYTGLSDSEILQLELERYRKKMRAMREAEDAKPRTVSNWKKFTCGTQKAFRKP